jgi:hypothetical protein
LRTKSYILFLPLLLSIQLHSQQVPDAETLITTLFGQQADADLNYQDFYESLYQYYLNPLDLNKATVEELRGLYLVNDKQIDELQSHKNRFGRLLSLHELQSMENFDTETIKKLAPFVTVTTDENTLSGLAQTLKKPDNHYLIFRHTTDLQSAKGYSPNNEGKTAYRGDQNNFYVRYRLQKFRKFSLGLTAEKDAGETLGWQPEKKQYGADYYSYHLMVQDVGIFKKVVVGDYQLQFGQGLILAGGFLLGKGAETILSVRRSSSGIRPHTSLLESNYFRGAACTFGFKEMEITPFISHKYLDAAIVYIDSIPNDEYANIRLTGLHRTNTEFASRKTIAETVTGLNSNLSLLNKKLQFGSTFLYTMYNKEVKPSSNKPYQWHEFKGEQNTNFSLYYSYFWRNISLFGEWGASKSGGMGLVQGALLSLGQKMDFSFVYRNFSPNLHTPYGNAFSENYKNSNERGMYWGMRLRLTHFTELTAYYDTYTFPWLKYKVSAPSNGHEWMVNLQHKFGKKVITRLQYRQENKERDTEIGLEKELLIHQRKNVSFQLEYKADKHIYFKSKAQGSAYLQNETPTSGFLISQDIGYDGKAFDVYLNSTLFDTDDFENRQYVFEKDVLYSFSFPFFTGKGVRNYVLIRWKASKMLSFWLKYGQTSYFDRQTVGSGYEETMGDKRSEIRWQCRLSF